MIFRVVLDSNVIISALFFGGNPQRIIQHAIAGHVHGFTSLPILDEVREVVQRPKFGLSPDQALSLIEELHELCILVQPQEQVSVITADPDDNLVLECAIEAQADMVISGDSHLLDLGCWRGIKMLSPAEAINMIKY